MSKSFSDEEFWEQNPTLDCEHNGVTYYDIGTTPYSYDEEDQSWNSANDDDN